MRRVLGIYASVVGLTLISGLLLPQHFFVESIIIISLVLLGALFFALKWLKPTTNAISSIENTHQWVIRRILLLFGVSMGARLLFITLFSFPAEKASIVYVIILVTLVVEHRKLSSLGIVSKGLARNLALGGVLGFVYYYTSMAASSGVYYLLFGRFLPFTIQSVIEALPFIVMAFALAGFGEELLFRGYIQGRVSGAFGRDNGLVISSVLFGIWHLPWVIPVLDLDVPFIAGYATSYFIATALSGIVIGTLYQSTGSLVGPIMIHGLWNTLITINPLMVPAEVSLSLPFAIFNAVAFGVVVLVFHLILRRPSRVLNPIP